MRRTAFAQRLNDFPPILCRLLARKKNGPPMTVEEIVNRSHQTPGVKNPLNPVQVENFSNILDWKHIYLPDALTFMYGCRVDLTDAKEFRRINDYLSKRPSFKYLRKSADWEKYYKPLFLKWATTHRDRKSQIISPTVRKLLERVARAWPS
jgi:hypothetical protein